MSMQQEVQELEADIGFPVRRERLSPAGRKPYDESFSYTLCQRFYGKEEELERAIRKTTTIIIHLLQEKEDTGRRAALFFALLGNMYHLKGDFRRAAGCFMKALGHDREDMTFWIELMFSLRANGDVREFEAIIFNLENVYESWRREAEGELTRERLKGIIENAV